MSIANSQTETDINLGTNGNIDSVAIFSTNLGGSLNIATGDGTEAVSLNTVSALGDFAVARVISIGWWCSTVPRSTPSLMTEAIPVTLW